MSRRTLAFLLLWGCLGRGPASAAKLEVSTDPDPLTLGQARTMVITVKGLPGEGRVLGDANVGEVERIDPAGDTLRVAYRPPPQRYPQVLCLALWRDGDIDVPIHVVRLPLFGQTEIPVKTRAGATVRVMVLDREFGPVTSGARGRARVSVLVPPAAREARVEVTDKVGLQTERRVEIAHQPFNQIALAITPRTRNSSGAVRFRVTLAVADPQRVAEAPRLEIGGRQVKLDEQGDGKWSGYWAPSRRPDAARVPIRAYLPGAEASQRFAEMGISPASMTVQVRRVSPPAPRRTDGRLQGDIGVVVGMTHNLGDLVAPYFGVEVGVEYRLPLGLVGVRLLAGYGWATQRVDAPLPLGEAQSTVMMVPVGGALSYRAPLRPLTPYVLWGCVAQIVRTTNHAPFLEPERSRTDVAFGVLGMAGASRPLGPGRLFLQLGYRWSELGNEDVEALAGGVVLEGGYRLEI
jgi:hypothetical protein